MQHPPQASSSVKKITSCDVLDCKINSKAYPEASFFSLPNDPVRREKWLKMMKRDEFLYNEKIQNELNICSYHFYQSDIIVSPFRNILKKNVNPSKHMPVEEKSDASVQSEACVSDFSTQTQNPVRQSDMVCQAGSTLITDLQRKRKIQDEYEDVASRLATYECGTEPAALKIFNQSCDNYLGTQLAELVKAAVNRNQKYTLAYRIFCLNLYHVSPQAYRLISEDFNLPPIKRLKAIQLPMSTDINEDILSTFHIKVRNMTETEKQCSVVVDIVRLKYNLFYSAKQDKVIGFHEIDGLQSPIPARYAVVLVVRGIFVNWTQPIGFAMISPTICKITPEEISKWIDKTIAKLLEMGLKVRTFVCTSKSKLLNEANIRKVTVDKPYFMLNDVKIFYIYDFPHMLRMLRNEFMTHDFRSDTLKCAKFNYVKEFFELDKKRELRIARALTESHINPSCKEKRDTKYAAELLNNSVAVGIDTLINFSVMSWFAKDTVEFLKMMNDLQEVMNVSVLSPATFRVYEEQIELLNQVLNYFQSLKLINCTTGQEVTSNVLFIKGMQVSIKSLLLLFEDLRKEQFKHLLTARLSLGVTEKLFKRIKAKSGKVIEPTSRRFVLKFRQLYFSHIIKPQNSGGISEDMGKAIAQLFECAELEKSGTKKVCTDNTLTKELQAGPSFCKSDDILTKNIQSVIQTTADIRTDFEIDEKELKMMAKIAAEVNSYSFIDLLLRKCIEYHDCNMLKHFLNLYEISQNLQEIKHDDEAIVVKEEPIRTEKLFDYVARMEDNFRVIFEKCRMNLKLVESIYESFQSDVFLNTYAPCPCFPTQLFQMMFIKVRVYMTVYYNNAVFRKKGDDDRIFFIPGL